MIYLIDGFQLQAEHGAPSLLSSLYSSMTISKDNKVPACNGILTFILFLLTKCILETKSVMSRSIFIWSSSCMPTWDEQEHYIIGPCLFTLWFIDSFNPISNKGGMVWNHNVVLKYHILGATNIFGSWRNIWSSIMPKQNEIVEHPLLTYRSPPSLC